MTWFKKKTPIVQLGDRTVRTEGLWTKCEECKQIVWKKDLEANFNVCPHCNFHFKISAKERLEQLFDEGEFVRIRQGSLSTDPLALSTRSHTKTASKKCTLITGLRRRHLCRGSDQWEISSCLCDGGGLYQWVDGFVVGEKITRSIERSLRRSFH